jgi:hypothetical protein
MDQLKQKYSLGIIMKLMSNLSVKQLNVIWINLKDFSNGNSTLYFKKVISLTNIILVKMQQLKK